MFKHKNQPSAPVPQDTSLPAELAKPTVAEKVFASGRPMLRDTTIELRELMEKNLKWSQIIYEQNRRINSKLFWTAFASWFKIIIFAATLAVGIFYLSPFVKQSIQLYNSIVGKQSALHINEPKPASIDDIIKLLPIDAAQREQIKQLFTKKS